MYEGRNLFAQIMDFLPRDTFDACVKKYGGNSYCKSFSCRDQFLAMAFAQLTLLDGLRGIQETLRLNSHCLYHMGFRCKTVSRNTLAHANKERPWQIYAELAMSLMKRAQKLYCNEPLGVDLDAEVFALDSTTIDLCLTRFPWTPFKYGKSGIKLHVLLDIRGSIPGFIVITDARLSDVKILDLMEYAPGAYYIVDRAYLSFQHLYGIHQSKAFFVIRAKEPFNRRTIESHAVDKSTGLRCDQRVSLLSHYPKKYYPESLRRIKFRDPETDKKLVFLTNDFASPALLIPELYKRRWHVELFFKWIKQHLKIKTFYGNSDNAVRTQIWIAVAVYCLLAIIRKELSGTRELHEIQEILGVSIFQKIPILRAFSREDQKTTNSDSCNQLSLF